MSRPLALLEDQAVIRAGRVLLVYCADARPLLSARGREAHGMVGPFHAAGLAAELDEAASSGRNILLAGPSGSGKELAAQAVARAAGKQVVFQNAARYSSEEEATTSLFGVSKGVFTGVGERAGYIEQADGGVLFLDEAHNLPVRVQKSMLRVVEDGFVARIGESADIKVNVRFVLASNEPAPTFGLTRDLLARLRLQRIPGLAQRVADVPGIFEHLLEAAFRKAGIKPPATDDLLHEKHHESLMLDGFEEDNVRGLQDLAERIASKVAAGAAPAEAVGEVFSRRYHASYISEPYEGEGVASRVTDEIPVPPYDHTEAHANVHDAYHRVGGNAAAIERDLREKGIDYSRKRITRILDEMELPRLRRG